MAIKTAFLSSSVSPIINRRRVYNDKVDTKLKVNDTIKDGRETLTVTEIKSGIW